MARYDNYPDDIRSYDHDHRSPFYEGKEDYYEARAQEIYDDEEKMAEIEIQILEQYGIEEIGDITKEAAENTRIELVEALAMKEVDEESEG